MISEHLFNPKHGAVPPGKKSKLHSYSEQKWHPQHHDSVTSIYGEMLAPVAHAEETNNGTIHLQSPPFGFLTLKTAAIVVSCQTEKSVEETNVAITVATMKQVYAPLRQKMSAMAQSGGDVCTLAG